MGIAVAFTCNSCGCHLQEPAMSLAEVADIAALGPPSPCKGVPRWLIVEYTDGRHPPVLVLCSSCRQRQEAR